MKKKEERKIGGSEKAEEAFEWGREKRPGLPCHSKLSSATLSLATLSSVTLWALQLPSLCSWSPS
jgi:hypothetical protein